MTVPQRPSGMALKELLKRSFVQKQVRVGGYDGIEGFAQKQGYVYSHNNSKSFVVEGQAESKERHVGHAKHVKIREHRISVLATENKPSGSFARTGFFALR